MSFLKNIFAKKPKAIVPVETPPSPAKLLAAQIAERLSAHTEKPAVAFSLEEGGAAGLFACKLGGAFYVPEDQSAPEDSHGQPMYLLAQLNFSELPALKDFPEKGLLQFFLTGSDDLYGADYDDPASQKNWCIRYLPEIPEERSVNETRIFYPAYTEKTRLLLFSEETCPLKASAITQSITLCDYRISDILRRTCADLLPEDFRDVYDLDDQVSAELLKRQELYRAQIGGYPDFIEYDPREEAEDAPDILLFQIESFDDITWGDPGVGNFFIRSEDLKNRDFSKVWYHWDGTI